MRLVLEPHGKLNLKKIPTGSHQPGKKLLTQFGRENRYLWPGDFVIITLANAVCMPISLIDAHSLS